ncbi:MAG: HEAT repeat domain-containing protein, partial [Calditrichaeota bacterium]
MVKNMMKKSIKTSIFLVILFTNIFAQNKSSLSGELEQLLSILPAPNATVADLVFKKILTLDKGVENLISVMQSEPQDTTLQYAISGLANYVTISENKNHRKDFNKSVCESLRRHASGNALANAFLLEQLKLPATDDVLKKIKPFLENEKLIDPAIAVFLSVGSKNAGKQLLEQLKKSPNKQKIKLIKALADLQFASAEKELVSLVKDEDDNISAEALHAMPALASADLLMEAIALHQTKAEKPVINYNALRLQATRRFIEKNDKKSALKIQNSLDTNTLAPQDYIQSLHLQIKLDPVKALQQCRLATEQPNEKIAVAAVAFSGDKKNGLP